MSVVLVLQHATWERPGRVVDALTGLTLVTRSVAAEPEPDLPAAESLAGLVVMGGPQRANDDATWPGLAAERRLLARAVDHGVPVLGVCLGMQLLAVALGAHLHSGHGEIGFATVDVRRPDPFLHPLGDAPTVLHWHSDAVDLPAGATLLASSATTPVQAFRIEAALGLQFHVEVGPGLLTEWLRTPEMTAGVPSAVLARLRADGPHHAERLAAGATAALATFAATVRERAGAE